MIVTRRGWPALEAATEKKAESDSEWQGQIKENNIFTSLQLRHAKSVEAKSTQKRAQKEATGESNTKGEHAAEG